MRLGPIRARFRHPRVPLVGAAWLVCRGDEVGGSRGGWWWGGFGRFSESQLGVAGARCTPIIWPSDRPRALKLRPITTPRKPVRGDVKHSDPALAPPTLPASLASETPLDPQTIRPTRRPRGSRPRITLLLILIKIPPDRHLVVLVSCVASTPHRFRTVIFARRPNRPLPQRWRLVAACYPGTSGGASGAQPPGCHCTHAHGTPSGLAASAS